MLLQFEQYVSGLGEHRTDIRTRRRRYPKQSHSHLKQTLGLVCRPLNIFRVSGGQLLRDREGITELLQRFYGFSLCVKGFASFFVNDRQVTLPLFVGGVRSDQSLRDRQRFLIIL
jgi:hypothetical protein